MQAGVVQLLSLLLVATLTMFLRVMDILTTFSNHNWLQAKIVAQFPQYASNLISSLRFNKFCRFQLIFVQFTSLGLLFFHIASLLL